MSVPRTSFKTAVINRKLYAIGGIELDNYKTHSSIEEYDPVLNKWTATGNLPVAKQIFELQVLNNSFLTFGGDSTNSPNGALSEVTQFNTLTNTSLTKPSMNHARFYFQTINLNNKIYAIGGIDNNNKYLNTLEVYTITSSSPTLTVTASPNKVKVGNQFTTTVAIHNVSNIYAEDIKIDYDSDRFEYVGASAKNGLKIYKEDTSSPGSVRFIVAHLGKGNGATGDKDLIELTFKAKSVGIGKVDIIKGRIADNDVLEMDVAEENCGEDTIEVEANKDVNRTGEYTLLDLGIDAYYYGMEAIQTDTTRFDTDVIPDGIIDDKDLAAITQAILDNSNYPFNS